MKEMGDYRAFAAAAKEAGLDKDERKLVAMDPALLLEGTNEELQKRLNPEMLDSFFHTLQHDKNANPKELLELGNFFYEYRADKNHIVESSRGMESLTEKDYQLINLGCILAENAFYEGNLGDLSNEQAASLAFVINVLAKLLKQFPDDEKLRGFDQEKLVKFVHEVHEYEQHALFPEAYDGVEELPSDKAGAAKERATEIRHKAAVEKINQAESLKPEGGWDSYFQDILSRFEKACVIADQVGANPAFNGNILLVVLGGLNAKLSEIIKRREEAVSKIATAVKTNFYAASNDTFTMQNLMRDSLSDSLLSKQVTNWAPPGSPKEPPYYYIIEYTRTLENIMSRLYKKLQESRSTAAKPRRGLESLGMAQADLKLPEAAEAMALVVDKNKQGLWGEYASLYEGALSIVRKTMRLKKFDERFVNAEKRLSSNIKDRATVPYLIKASLIVNSLAGPELKEQRASVEDSLAGLEGRYELKGDAVASHAFIKGKNPEDNGPAYANLHFMKEELPLAVWANRYLRSKHKES